MKFNCCFLLLFVFSITLFSKEKLDGIVAIVGDEIILSSELDAYTAMRLTDSDSKNDTNEYLKRKTEFLNEIIDGKILLVHGRHDSTISVTQEEVVQATNNHISMLLKQNNISIDSLDAELQRQQGITLAKFKHDAKKIIREQLIKQKVHQQYLYNTKITRKDVIDFYNHYKDSLPEMGESVNLTKYSIEIVPSEKNKQKSYEKIIMIKNLIGNGENFTELAKKYSESPEASEGGNLGFISKGTLNEIIFEEKAFNLSLGQVSDPFETRLGFHIIKILEKRDQQVKIQQIFIEKKPPKEEIEYCLNAIDSIKINCKKSIDCLNNSLKTISKNNNFKLHREKLGWVQLAELPASVKMLTDSISFSELSKTSVLNNIVFFYRVNNKVTSRKLTLENDFPLLEEKAKDIAAQKKLISLVKKWKSNIFIEIRL